MLADAIAKVVAGCPAADAIAKKWTAARGEWPGYAGFSVIAALAADPKRPDDHFAALIPEIEAGIHQRPNRTRHAMNMALIAIGLRSPALRKAATEAARRIGPVEVDHGDTGCKTPDAIAYIAKSWERKKARA